MSVRIQLGKQKSSMDDIGGSRGRKYRRLPPVVLKSYLDPKIEIDNRNLNGKHEEELGEIDASEESPEIKCPKCEKIFPDWMDLYQHCENEHPTSGNAVGDGNGDESEIPEEGIDESMEFPGNDSEHGNSDSANDSEGKIRTTWCDICKKHLATVSSRNLHMRIHTGERPFVCPFCNKAFTQNVHLRSHMSVHTGAKPYVCDVCGKGFVAGRTLKIHMMSHTRETPHTCRWCSRKFLLRNHLLLHMQTHHASDQASQASPKRSSPEIAPPAVPAKSSKTKYHLKPPQRVLVFNDTHGESVNGKSIDFGGNHAVGGKFENLESGNSNNQQILDEDMESLISPAIRIKSESPDNCRIAPELTMPINNSSGRKSMAPRKRSAPPTRLAPAQVSIPNGRKSKFRPPVAKESVEKSKSDTHQKQGQSCPNCAIVDSELQLLKTELSVIKQFLGSKLSLMEQKIENIQVLIK